LLFKLLTAFGFDISGIARWPIVVHNALGIAKEYYAKGEIDLKSLC
jgi:uncharacterized membrane protein